MSRLAVLSDIHGNLPALEAVIADARAKGCDSFVNLGDILSGPLWPAETADLLMPLGWPTLAGNHERQLLTESRTEMCPSDRYAADRLDERHMQWLATLPGKMQYSDAIFLCHGTPESDLLYFLEDVGPEGAFPASLDVVDERAGEHRDALVLCGHTHKPRAATLPDGRIVANPGSVGLPGYHASTPFPHDMEAGTPHARYAIVDGLNVTLMQVAYDHEAVAAKAEEAGWRDWAQALRYGHMGR